MRRSLRPSASFLVVFALACGGSATPVESSHHDIPVRLCGQVSPPPGYSCPFADQLAIERGEGQISEARVVSVEALSHELQEEEGALAGFSRGRHAISHDALCTVVAQDLGGTWHRYGDWFECGPLDHGSFPSEITSLHVDQASVTFELVRPFHQGGGEGSADHARVTAYECQLQGMLSCEEASSNEVVWRAECGAHCDDGLSWRAASTLGPFGSPEDACASLQSEECLAGVEHPGIEGQVATSRSQLLTTRSVEGEECHLLVQTDSGWMMVEESLGRVDSTTGSPRIVVDEHRRADLSLNLQIHDASHHTHLRCLTPQGGGVQCTVAESD